jgi:hypothetical protein
VTADAYAEAIEEAVTAAATADTLPLPSARKGAPALEIDPDPEIHARALQIIQERHVMDGLDGPLPQGVLQRRPPLSPRAELEHMARKLKVAGANRS